MTTTIAPGFLTLHPNQPFNFFMNRLAWTNDAEELKAIGTRITTIEDWIREMQAAAKHAEDEDRLLAAANYWRAAEFYMAPEDAGKADAYNKFIELHDRALPDVAAQRKSVPYAGGKLPVIELPAVGTQRGTILAHSGFDGVAEEMYTTMGPFADAGYRVIVFEGPGQGGALRFGGLHMTHDWEKPVGAVLDHFGIEECTLIGMSLGGYLAPRAAAFDSRITRVVAWGAMYDFLGCFRQGMGEAKFAVIATLLRLGARKQVNAGLEKAGRANPLAKWALAHGRHVSGSADGYDFFRWLMQMNLRGVSQQIKQDVLIVMGTKDHLVPFDQVHQQARALTNARSVSVRIATEQEQGAEHCQIGNPMLVVDEVLRWMQGLDNRDASLAQHAA